MTFSTSIEKGINRLDGVSESIFPLLKGVESLFPGVFLNYSYLNTRANGLPTECKLVFKQQAFT